MPPFSVIYAKIKPSGYLIYPDGFAYSSSNAPVYN